MKSMILFAVFMVAALGAQSASASCKSDFASFQDKSKVELKYVRSVQLNSKKDFSNLRSPELKAVSNYMKYLEFRFEHDQTLFVETSKYQSISDKSSLGYRISVTDGGDESQVTYYIKIDVGLEDVAYPILYRFWSNQSPERDWLCETR